MLFLLYHLWVLVHLNYRDIKQLSHKGGGHRPSGPPGSYAPRHRLFTSSIKREIWHFLALVVQWWLKKCTKKACCTCRVVALPIHFIAFLTLSLSSPFWHLKVPDDDFCCLIIGKPQPLSRGNLYSRDTCFGPEGVLWIEVWLYLFYLLLQVYFLDFKAHLITFCALHCEPVDFFDRYYYDNLW